jgi:hypothetical protein
MAFATLVHSNAAANKALLQESAEIGMDTGLDQAV